VTQKFIKRNEDFRCEKCGHEVKGSGYTNHCPKCLWSKHVDINPGDRQNECEGMMEPVGVKKEGEEYSLIHKCEKCGATKKNKVAPQDDFQKIIKISSA
jgi:hypothetical protein